METKSLRLKQFEFLHRRVIRMPLVFNDFPYRLTQLNSTIYSIGVGSQRIAKIGEMDVFTLTELDNRLITFRVFGNLPAQVTIIADE